MRLQFRKTLIGGLLLLSCAGTFAAITYLRPIRVAYTSWRLKDLRSATTSLPRNGTDEYICALIADGALYLGISKGRLIDILGMPDQEIPTGDGCIDLVWIACDYGSQVERYVVRINSKESAVFVPFLRRIYQRDGLKVAEYVRSPEG